MPKNPVTDPITDPEIAFAHLIMSGTMNDRQAAEAAGLNPNTAAYTKGKPRIQEYIDHHRSAVSRKLVDQEAEGLRSLSIGRDQMLARLWELANISPAETRGSIAGQVKAMGMLLAVEGLLPGRRLSSAPDQPAAPAPNPKIFVSEWLRERQEQNTEPEESVTATEAQPAIPPVPATPPSPAGGAPSVQENQASSNPDSPSLSRDLSWVPNAIGPNLDTYTNTASTLRPPFAPGKRRFGRGR